MPKGESGRVVIEVEPVLKRRLYSALAIENSTLKQWFIDSATQYVADHEPPTCLKRTRKKKGKAAMNFIENESEQKLRGGYTRRQTLARFSRAG